jgi:hypothetical protein
MLVYLCTNPARGTSPEIFDLHATALSAPSNRVVRELLFVTYACVSFIFGVVRVTKWSRDANPTHFSEAHMIRHEFEYIDIL